MNQDMSQFNTKSLLDHFPVPLFSTHGAPAKEAPPKPKWKSRLQSFPFSLFSSLSSSPTQQPPGTAAAPVQVAANPLGELMQRVMIEMMKTRLPGFQPPRLVDGTWPGGGFTWSENPIVMGGGGGTDECGISDHVRDAGILKRVCKNGHMDVARWIVERFNIREPWEVVGPFRGAVSKGHLALAQWLFNTFHLGECVFRDQEVSCSVHLKAYRSENLEVVKWCFEAFPREEPIYGLFSDYGTGKKSSSVDICKFITERMSGTGSLFKTVHRVDVLKWATSFTSAIPTSVARFCKGKGGLELVRYAVEEYSIKPTPDDFIAACKTKSKEGVALVRWLSTKVTLSPSDLGNSLTVALARDNTAIATWLDETFNIMKRLSAWNSAPGVLLLKVCKATKYYHERVKGVEWIMSFPEMGCVEESLVVRAVNKLVNRGLSTTPLLLMEKFTISEPTRTNLLLGILKESIQSDGITQAKKIISMGDFTKSSVARCLTNAVGLRSTKAVKWLIMHFQLDRGHITTYKNKILLRMMEQGKESCAEWLIKKFHVTLEEVLDLPFNLDPGNKFDLFMWEMIVRQFRGTITGTKIKQRLFPVILHSPFIALSAIRLFPDLTMDYIITLCQSTTPFDLTLDTRCWFRHCYNHH
ncbi:hypothetical protein Pelo_6092 [Pelomyxa schiedti]|nr:hypothetical protein Pelo_6092 [Pelomyxa schiedti]